MAFHAGVLNQLAHLGLLESIKTVSTVSGGTLFMGLLFKYSDWKWPTSAQYIEKIYPSIRSTLTTSCLQSTAMRMFITQPRQWQFAISRSNILANAIVDLWGVDQQMSSLPDFPSWSANGTTAETGRRFRFKKGRCGDYELGYAGAEHFRIADAMAASAAYPLLIGPLSIDARKLTWTKQPVWGGLEADEVPISPMFPKIHIMDGGVYDNLGMEPIFDMKTGEAKDNLSHIFLSDGGASLRRVALPAFWRPSRLSRVAEIAMDQVHALRIRSFFHSLNTGNLSGAYFKIGWNSNVMSGHHKSSIASEWLTLRETMSASSFPTNLRKMSIATFDLIGRHGFETVLGNPELKQINN